MCNYEPIPATMEKMKNEGGDLRASQLPSTLFPQSEMGKSWNIDHDLSSIDQCRVIDGGFIATVRLHICLNRIYWLPLLNIMATQSGGSVKAWFIC